MIRTLVLVGLLATSIAALDYNETYTCAQPCQDSTTCHGTCSFCSKHHHGHLNGKGFCQPACGKSCKTNADCGQENPKFMYTCPICRNGKCDFPFGPPDKGVDCHPYETDLPTGGTPPQPGHPTEAPVLPTSWNASVDILNYTDGSKSQGQSWYDYRFEASRFDYPAPCPFNEGVTDEINNGPCTVVFLNHGQHRGNYYIYPESELCCQYPRFPTWPPDVFQKANATYIGTYPMPLGTADIWDSTYACDWYSKPQYLKPNFPIQDGLMVQRRVFVDRATGHLVGINETLSSSVSSFTRLSVGPQDLSIFTDPITKHNCINVHKNRPFPLRQCQWVPAAGKLGFWGYS